MSDAGATGTGRISGAGWTEEVFRCCSCYSCSKEAGIPWFVFLDGDGKAVIDSTDPDNGNVGFPAADSEIAWFKVMLEKVAKRITREDIEMLAQSLVAFRDVKLPQR
jgi:hypothetical protein